ncbi:GNAT family N-acetyltransferase [Rhizobium multihospitium]|uniref:Ribosomal protein S18 acetylase RimI n=1 Tax=Rhizobium multihospitium TaxID=410764 RepID=A0A1C3XC29_9HYPH|nr:GNAT family N-acetyltransferase [Rhizobium multihospitium]SCB49666.1 Ribosomal protein S18 acetylase RimI [Rhizobium multihospitium]
MKIDIRPVDLEIRAHFSEILEEASAWQKARGSEGWNYPFDDAWMLPRIERRELFLAYMGGQPVAAFRILLEDRPYWGEKETGDSIYLHTFAVCRNKAGNGIGKTVIEKIAGMGRERGLANIRLDCSLSSSKLIAYYEKNGFASVGTTFMNGKMMNLMERPLQGNLPSGL